MSDGKVSFIRCYTPVLIMQNGKRAGRITYRAHRKQEKSKPYKLELFGMQWGPNGYPNLKADAGAEEAASKNFARLKDAKICAVITLQLLHQNREREKCGPGCDYRTGREWCSCNPRPWDD